MLTPEDIVRVLVKRDHGFVDALVRIVSQTPDEPHDIYVWGPPDERREMFIRQGSQPGGGVTYRLRIEKY